MIHHLLLKVSLLQPSYSTLSLPHFNSVSSSLAAQFPHYFFMTRSLLIKFLPSLTNKYFFITNLGLGKIHHWFSFLTFRPSRKSIVPVRSISSRTTTLLTPFGGSRSFWPVLTPLGRFYVPNGAPRPGVILFARTCSRNSSTDRSTCLAPSRTSRPCASSKSDILFCNTELIHLFNWGD